MNHDSSSYASIIDYFGLTPDMIDEMSVSEKE